MALIPYILIPIFLSTCFTCIFIRVLLKNLHGIKISKRVKKLIVVLMVIFVAVVSHFFSVMPLTFMILNLVSKIFTGGPPEYGYSVGELEGMMYFGVFATLGFSFIFARVRMNSAFGAESLEV